MPKVTPPTVAPAPRVVGDAEAAAPALRALLAGDQAAARRAIMAVDDRAQRARLGLLVTRQFAAQAPEKAGEFAVQLPAEAGQLAAVDTAMGAFVARDPAAALRWAHGIAEPGPAALARRAVAHRLMQSPPGIALDQIAGLPAGTGRDDLMGFAVASWARREPDAAVAWVRARSDDELKQRLTSTVGFELAQLSPDRAVELAETLPAGRNRWLLFSAIAQTWVATDSKSALAWAGRLPEGEARAAAFSGLETGLGVPMGRRTGAGPGSRGVRSRGFGGGASGGLGEAALAAGGSADFAAWLATQPSQRSRDEAIVEYVQQRGAADSGAIGQWLSTLSPGPARDRAMEIYLEGQLIGSPHRAASWLRSLPRSDRSDAMIERTARAWLQTNPDAAQAWLLETPLPPDRKERLLREAGR